MAELSAGFGPDMSFQVVDSDNVSTEIGVMGMMMTGDGSANADFVFKTWNGQSDAAMDAAGGFNRLVIKSSGDVMVPDGRLDVMRSAYPVTVSERVAESATNTEEMDLSKVTRSAFTASRKSTKYTMAELSAGFGPDISFQVVDSDNVSTEIGVMGMMMTGDGSANADFVFKTWNGQSDAAMDAAGDFNRLVIKSSGDVMVPDGRLDVMRSAYPVTVSERVAESVTNTEEMDLSKVTRSAFTASRKSNNYTLAQMNAGFGPDMSFQVVDSAGVSTEIGVMGMMMTGDGSANADFVFKTWNGQSDAAMDAAGEFNRLVIKSSGDVMVPDGRLDVMRSAYPVTVSERVAESATNTEEMDLMKVTRSAFTASRKSTKYTMAELSAGFGPDMSFQVVDSDNVSTEIGVMGMMMTGDGSANADFVFKTWNGQSDAAMDAAGDFNRLVIKSSGDVMVPDGRLDVMRSAYPVTVSERVAESAMNTEEMDLSKVTRSAFTASRKSNNYTLAQMNAGFGPDMSFQVVDSAGVSTEIGVMGMMMTGDGSANADFVFKTWNGQSDAAMDAAGDFNRLVIKSSGDVMVPDGRLDVMRSAYPVTVSERVAESATNTEEMDLMKVTRSAFTASRKSTKYTMAELSAGFGPDMSFQVVDSDNVSTEIGVMGMMMTGDGSANADFVFKTWNGQSDAAMDAAGEFNRLVIKSSGDVMVPDGRLDVMRSAYPVTVSERVAESATNTEEIDLMKVTRSAFTASRKSNNYTLAQMSAGFGPDMSFQVVDSAGVSTEIGVMGMMMTGDGSANADFVFKTWNGQSDAAMDAAGDFNRLVIKSSGDVMVPDGRLDVMRSAYPVTVSERVAESAMNSEEMDLSKVTRSAFTASRKSNNYTLAQMNAGFGPDMSFQVVDSAGVSTEIGVMGMMMTGDGSANADFVFKTWNGQSDAAMDAAGDFNRLVIKSSGDVMVPDGRLDVMRSAYPVTVSERVAESAVNSEEMELSKVTRSAFTASRKSNNYTLAQMNAGFGPDMSFQVVDSAGVSKELGVMGMVMTGDGSAHADFVFKTWNGQAEEANFAAMDAAGEFNRLVIKSNGDVLVPNGELLVQGESFRGISTKISDLEDDYDFILTLLIILFVILLLLCLILFCFVAYLLSLVRKPTA